MDPKIAGAIERFRRSLEDRGIRVSRIVLFGSYATGSPQPHSDIDLAVISDDFHDMNLLERLEAVGLSLARARIAEPIEALAYTEDEYDSQEHGTFVNDEVKAKGVPVP